MGMAWAPREHGAQSCVPPTDRINGIARRAPHLKPVIGAAPAATPTCTKHAAEHFTRTSTAALVDFATVIWPPLLSKFGPPATLTAPCRSPRDRGGLVGQERPRGVIRGDSARVSEWGRNDQRHRSQAGGASARGPAGVGRCDPTGAAVFHAREAGGGPGAGVYRSHLGGRSDGAAEAAAHGAPHSRSARSRMSGGADRIVDGAEVCAGLEARPGSDPSIGVCAPDVRLGPGGAGRLVRSRRGPGRRRRHPPGVLCAQHGERRGLSSRLSARDAAGVSRSARGRVCLLRRRLRDVAVRQSDERGAQDSARLPA